MARDGSAYFGVEGGIFLPQDTEVDVDVSVDGEEFEADDAFSLDYKKGYDLDLVAGYDFGMFRAEVELGQKRAKTDQIEVRDDLLDAIEEELGEPITNEDLQIDAKARIRSLMGNLLIDLGNEEAMSFYVGGGFGRAWVKAEGESESSWAAQLIAGVRAPLSPNIHAGLKYRYFRTPKVSYSDAFDYDGMAIGVGADTRFTSHSLLASLIFNFGAPAEAAPMVAPPPAPPAPATQTCPDGSVILATELCPMAAPPPPPPPPAPAGERG
jgi:opacity protein-like surface antigen